MAANAKSVKVENINQFNNQLKNLSAGDSIILSNGTWKDASLVFKGKGEKDKYIYLTAETPGKVSLEGASSLRISGQWLHVSGLVPLHYTFQQLQHHSRLTVSMAVS